MSDRQRCAGGRAAAGLRALGVVLQIKGEDEEANRLHREAIETHRKLAEDLDADRPDSFETLGNLWWLLEQ